MKRTHGFTLIELMVGVALGLLATLVIAQVFLQSEGNKRSTTSGADAQVAGAVALYTLQRDIQTAGYGLTTWAAGLGCPLSGQNSGTVLDPASDILAPVVINFGAAAADSDTITVLASGKAAYSVPMKLSAVHAQIDGQFTLSTIMGVAVNDLMLAVPSTWSASTGCTLFMATAVSSTTVTHASPGSGWNASTAIFPSGGYDTSSVVINLGPSPVRRRYSVNATSWSLQVQDMLTSSGVGTAQEMFPQVVLLKALYGMATAKNGPVTTYSAKPPVTNDDWRYVQSVRVVVVARSAQYEKDVVTTSSQLMWDLGPLALTSVTNAGTVSTCNTTNHCVALDVSASGSGTDWQHYRYKIFDTVVPLRNVVWNP